MDLKLLGFGSDSDRILLCFQMTEMEYERRRVTGTLNSSTITTKAVELLTMDGSMQTPSKQPAVSILKGRFSQLIE